jgi:hypothetical protein
LRLCREERFENAFRLVGRKSATGITDRDQQLTILGRLGRDFQFTTRFLLFREYKQSLAYTKKVAVRSRGDYEWAMGLLCDTHTKSGDRVGSRPIRTVTPRGADKLYQKLVIGPNGRRDRTAEKVVKLCRKAWRVLHRLFPDEFPKDAPNPPSPDRIEFTQAVAEFIDKGEDRRSEW